MSDPAIPDLKPTVEPTIFNQCDLRVGIVQSAEPLEGAKIPAYRLTLDLGPLGVKQSSARLTRRYRAEDLVGRRVVAVVNFPPRRVAGFKSEVLVLGAVPGADAAGHDDVSLLNVDHDDIPPGTSVA